LLKIFTFKYDFRGRIRHGRHFTFKGATGNATITFVAPSVAGTLVSDDKPFVAQGSWLHVLLPNSFLDIMESSLKFLHEPFTVITFINIFYNLSIIK
jgi:suppressor of fused-like protein